MQCAPARAARSLPCEPPPSSRSWDRGAALTGLGLTARVGNLQLEGEPGKRWLCRAASLPLAARKGLGQVLLSNTAGPVPGAGRWRGLAPLSARHGSQGWARRNTPPGGSEFPFRWTVFDPEGQPSDWCSETSPSVSSESRGTRPASPPPTSSLLASTCLPHLTESSFPQTFPLGSWCLLAGCPIPLPRHWAVYPGALSLERRCPANPWPWADTICVWAPKTPPSALTLPSASPPPAWSCPT